MPINLWVIPPQAYRAIPPQTYGARTWARPTLTIMVVILVAFEVSSTYLMGIYGHLQFLHHLDGTHLFSSPPNFAVAGMNRYSMINSL